MILGTAGHVDHGKTTLVRALTGVDTDRLPEEKKRGITIELGFAPLEIPGVGTVGVVDVPGHEAFVRTMLAGATGIDLALLVIAADEGLMPQTREHLAILNLLGVRGGVIALTKADLAEPDWMDLVEEDTRAATVGGPLATAPIVRCSASTGVGLDALRDALTRAVRTVPARASGDLFRMPLDRAFSVRGTGTVVTGTIWSGGVMPEDAVRLLPRDVGARVRAVESHGKPQAAASGGARVALALGGVNRADVDLRGAVLVSSADPWSPTQLLRADVALLGDAPTIGPRTRVRLHLGTADVGARLVAAGRPVAPGTHLPVRISLDTPLVARAGDRFVLRAASPASTIGGGIVTDPNPPTRRVKPWPHSGADESLRLIWMLAEASGRGVDVASLPIRLGVRRAEAQRFSANASGLLRVGNRLYSSEVAESVRNSILAEIDTAHRVRTLEPGVPVQSLRSTIRASPELVDHVLEALVADGTLAMHEGFAARKDWSPGGGPADEERLAAVRSALDLAGHTPPSVDELTLSLGSDTPMVLRLLARRGEVIHVASDRYFSLLAVDELTRRVVTALAGGAALSTSELRERTGLTRKYVIQFLEFCDKVGVTARRGDTRILGKRGEPKEP